ncbi:MAG: hypothetical protein WD646_12750 [Actinomycetota bacterium]
MRSRGCTPKRASIQIPPGRADEREMGIGRLDGLITRELIDGSVGWNRTDRG